MVAAFRKLDGRRVRPIPCGVRPIKMVRLHLGVERTEGGLTVLREEFAVVRRVRG